MTFDDMNLEYEMNIRGKHQALKEARVKPLEEKVVDNTNQISLADSINQSDFHMYVGQLLTDMSKDTTKKKSVRKWIEQLDSDQTAYRIISSMEKDIISEVLKDKQVKLDYQRHPKKWKSDKELYKKIKLVMKERLAKLIDGQEFITKGKISGSGTTPFVIYNLKKYQKMGMLKDKESVTVEMPRGNIGYMNSLKFKAKTCEHFNRNSHVDVFDNRLVKQKRRHGV